MSMFVLFGTLLNSLISLMVFCMLALMTSGSITVRCLTGVGLVTTPDLLVAAGGCIETTDTDLSDSLDAALALEDTGML